jgi:hypothetical protein
MVAASVLLVVSASWLASCAPADRPAQGDVETDALFVDRAAETGLDFVHFNGMSGEFYFIEPLAPGGALFDYDNDGDLDVYIVQGQMLGDRSVEEAIFPPNESPPLRDRLFRNDLVETGELRFVDATDESGIASTGYGMGVAAGDYDADGFVDLYITDFESNLLLRNNGDGTFSDTTHASGAEEDRWSASAAFVDYDGDGHLDLFITNYVDFTVADPGRCYGETTAIDYCGPLSYKAVPDRLFRNRGDGSFEDVTAVSGIARAYGAGLGVVSSDFNGDGLVDFYVANDDHPNQLWINRGDGRFDNEALFAGCALNASGQTEAGMGIVAADFDGDGDDDLFLTHLSGETNTLYVNDGSGVFEDRSVETRLASASRPFTGFGTGWLDFDNDGWLDLIVANGAVKKIEALAAQGDPHPLHETNLLFRNRGDGSFEDVTSRAGEVFALSEVSRAAVIGDVDNDGDSDVLLLNNSGPPRLLINEIGSRKHWVGLQVMEGDGRLHAIGARVEVEKADGTRLQRQVRVAAGYCSSNDPRLLVGLGDQPEIRAVRVTWPDGDREAWRDVAADRYTVLVKGSGGAADG